MQVKLFYGSLLSELQDKINLWLSKNPDLLILDIKQSESSTFGESDGLVMGFTFSFFYRRREGGVKTIQPSVSRPSVQSRGSFPK